METIAVIVFALFIMVLGVVFFGAPYVPTRARDLDKLFETAGLKRSDVLVDLGCGDGRLLLAAAERGIKSVGIELSPVLAFITWLRIRRVRSLARVEMADYWGRDLPDDTTVVFVFLAKPFMNKLKKYLQEQSARLGRPLTLVSYGFPLPGYKPVAQRDAVLVYKIKA